MQASDKVLYIISVGPYSTAAGLEALDAILIGASFDLDVSILFVHDGVFQLKSGQDSNKSELKEYTKTFRALSDFGIDEIFVHDLSMIARGLEIDDLIVSVKVLNSLGVQNLLASRSKVFTF